MKYGVIDLGSNTVKLLIYFPEGDKLNILHEKRQVVGLSSYLLPEGYLSDLGILKAIEVVDKFVKEANKFGVDELYVLATAIVRNSRNHNEIINRINQATNANVILLSGEEEAKYGVLGVLNEYEIKEGVIFDVGGGSTEVSIIKENEPIFSTSISIGCLNSYVSYVKDILPTKNEQLLIEKGLTKALKENNVFKEKLTNIYGIGGTIKALSKLYASYTNKVKKTFNRSDINFLFQKLKESNKQTYLHLIRVVPERLHTIMPGLIIINNLFNYFESDDLFICENGLREGFLLNKLKLEE